MRGSIRTALIQSSRAFPCRPGFHPHRRILWRPSHPDTQLIPTRNHARCRRICTGRAKCIFRFPPRCSTELKSRRDPVDCELMHCLAVGAKAALSMCKLKRGFVNFQLFVIERRVHWKRRIRSTNTNKIRIVPCYASVGTVAGVGFAAIAARPRNINPKLISSHFHQRSRPRRICL